MQPLADGAAYGEAVADLYDNASLLSPDAAADHPVDVVRFLAERAGAGPVLELGVGTGRVAIPLAAAGVRMHGLDVSGRMLEVLRAKPGGHQVETHLGDMANLDVTGPFTLVYVIGSSLFGVADQDGQVRCVAGVASVLTPGGLFVVEAFVPDVARLVDGRVMVREVDAGGVHLDATVHDPATQTLTSQQIIVTGEGVKLYPSTLRYLWPSELDLMCRLAGLSLVERFGGWNGQPYTGNRTHVSVYTT